MSQPVYLPRHIGIELVHDGSGAGRRVLDLRRLERLVAEIDRLPSPDLVWLAGRGEPLSHPDYRQCLAILSRSQALKSQRVAQHTDGTGLHGDAAQAILDSHVVTEVVLTVTRAAFDWERVAANVEDFVRRARDTRPELSFLIRADLPRPGELPLIEHAPAIEVMSRLRNLLASHGATLEPRIAGDDPFAIVDRPSSRVFGGCPFVEADTLYFTTEGTAKPCPVISDDGLNLDAIGDIGLEYALNGEPIQHLRHALRMDDRGGLPGCSKCPHSLGGSLDTTEFVAYWKRRDDSGGIADQSERERIFGELAPTSQRVVRVDLGCGRIKLPGFIGVDRFPLPGVDRVGDLDERLPFDDDAVDLLYACHSLEHVRDLNATIREVYRICKHGSQVCIVGPYYSQGLNVANPYHKHAFNEHTPRFWTAAETTLIDPAEYYHPHAPAWGLLESDNTTPDIDIRCIRMEFFYFPDYRNLPSEKQRWHRQHEFDVCDQVVYHLLVLKRPTSDEEFQDMARQMEPFESPYVALRRLHDRAATPDREHVEVVSCVRQLEQDGMALRVDRDRIAADFFEVAASKDQLEGQLADAVEYARRLEREAASLRAEQDRIMKDLADVVAFKSHLELDLAGLASYTTALEADLTALRQSQSQAIAEVEQLRTVCARIGHEATTAREESARAALQLLAQQASFEQHLAAATAPKPSQLQRIVNRLKAAIVPAGMTTKR